MTHTQGCRMGSRRDIAAVLALQERNLVTKLSDDEKRNGFVTTPFSDQQLQELIAIAGLFVIEEDGRLIGYAAAAGWDYFAGRPMFDLMLQRFVQISYRGELISPLNSFQYGPVCIDGAVRGSDAFPNLFAFMRLQMAARYTIGTTFINRMNLRSIRAHVDKIGLDVIDEFVFNDQNYLGLGFLTRS